ncbi:MAG TPA: phosphoribosyltransferase family protein [Hyphomicrobiales bacterium]|nr:phosphoribosyltransferase family protein [Hyphomicrobiales bacterium]
MNKHFISADQLLQDSLQLALRIIEGNWHPTLIVGIWRGGTPVGIAVHEALAFIGIDCDHIAIRASSYTGIDTRVDVAVEGLDTLQRKLGANTKLLLVDDVYDTGLSIARIKQELQALRGDNAIEVRVATPYFKPTNNRTPHAPDYYVHTTADWLVFPHELQGLSDEEAMLGKRGLEPQMTRLVQARRRFDATSAAQSG